MTKYIPLEELFTYLKDRKTQRVWLSDSEEYAKNAEMDNMKIHFESLPSIDHIATIDEMIEELELEEQELGSIYNLERLKSRLSLTK